MCVCVCVCVWVGACVRAYVRACVRACMRACVRDYTVLQTVDHGKKKDENIIETRPAAPKT